MTDIPVPFQIPDPAAGNPANRLATITPPLLIGRERDVEQVLALLDQDHVRLLTLTGPGGVGKTRLALEVSRRVADQFAHGSSCVSLAPIRDPTLVPAAVAAELGLRDAGARDPASILLDWLRSRHFLLVLDNMEQVIDAAHPWLSGLVAACPRLKVLVTSRIALDIASEQRYRVPPLKVPCASDVDDLAEIASVALFLQRARNLRSDLETSAEGLRDIAGICRRLDGLPLAIELAAARITILSPAEILAQLTDTSSLLTSTRRDAPPRFRSLHDAIAWSYDLLGADEQALFRRLAVHGGGFTLPAAGAMAAALQSGEVPARVDRLIGLLADHSLIERSNDVTGTRFRMLETIRDFGLAQLTTTGELDAARNAHATYFIALAAEARVGLFGHDQIAWFDRVEAEHTNFRDAMSWLTERGRIAEAIEIYHNIELVMLLHAHYAECRAFVDAWLASFDSNDRSRAHALVLSALGTLAVFHEDEDLGDSHTLQALELFREIGDREQVMAALGSLAFVWRIKGDIARARVANCEHLALARESGNARAMALALRGRAEIERASGNPAVARTTYEASLAAAREAGLALAVAHCLSQLAKIDYEHSGLVDRARGLLTEAVSVLERIGDRRNLPFLYFDLARIDEALGHVHRARANLDAALVTAQGTGLAPHEGQALMLLGMLEVRHGNVCEAHRHLRNLLLLHDRGSYHPSLADTMTAMADLAVASGDAPAAGRFLGTAETMLARYGRSADDNWSDDERDRLRERIRATGGKDALERFTAEAASWTRDEAIRTALDYQSSSTVAAAATLRRHGLSPRELDVLRLMADGRTNQEIADTLFVSLRTVTTHITAILGKLDLSSRTAAVAWAIRNGVV